MTIRASKKIVLMLNRKCAQLRLATRHIPIGMSNGQAASDGQKNKK